MVVPSYTNPVDVHSLQGDANAGSFSPRSVKGSLSPRASVPSQPPCPPLRAAFNLAKCMVGSGLLVLPWGVMKAGLGVSVVGMALIAWMTATATRLMVCHIAADNNTLSLPTAPVSHERPTRGIVVVGTWQVVCYTRVVHEHPLVGSAGEGMGASGWDVVSRKALGPWGLWVTMSCLILSQLGVCVTYVDVVSDTVLSHVPEVSETTVLVALWALFSVLCQLKELRSVAWLSALALAIYGGVIGVLVYYGSEHVAQEGLPALSLVRLQGLGRWFGVTLFAFEGIGVALAVHESMQTGPDPRPFVRVLHWVYVVCFFAYAFVGVFGYVCFGDDTDSVILLNFPPESALTIVVECGVGAIIFLSYVLQSYPLIRIAETVTGVAHGETAWPSMILRCTLVFLTCVIAYAIPDVDSIVGLNGAVAFSALGFVLPAAFHLSLFAGELGLLEWAQDVLILATGVCGGVLGAISTIGDM